MAFIFAIALGVSYYFILSIPAILILGLFWLSSYFGWIAAPTFWAWLFWSSLIGTFVGYFFCIGILGRDVVSIKMISVFNPRLVEKYSFIIFWFLFSFGSFWLCTLSWSHYVGPAFKQEATLWNSFTFALDLAIKGVLFDYLEHYKLTVTSLKMLDENTWFTHYSFIFRAHISAVLISSAFAIKQDLAMFRLKKQITNNGAS